MKFIFASLILLAALSAYAAEYTAGTKCPTAVHAKPMKNLEYKAGVTVDGYGVAPADEVPPVLSADSFQEIALPLNIPVSDFIDADRINLNTEEADLNVGLISANAKTGEIAFNGQDITSPEPTLVNPDCW